MDGGANREANREANRGFLSVVGGPDPQGGELHGGDLRGAGLHRVRGAQGVPEGQRALYQVSSVVQTRQAAPNSELRLVTTDTQPFGPATTVF